MKMGHDFDPSGMINLRPPNNFIMPAGEGKGEIGYISSPNFQTKPTKVKAAIAHGPVATESLQRPPQSPGRLCFFWSVVDAARECVRMGVLLWCLMCLKVWVKLTAVFQGFEVCEN